MDGRGRSVEYPGDQRRHHLANCFAVPGLFVQQKALQNWPAKPGDAGDSAPQLVIGYDGTDQTSGGTRFNFCKDGSVTITQGSTTPIQIDSSGVVSLGDEVANTQFTVPYTGSGNLSDWASGVKDAVNELQTQYGNLRTDLQSTSTCDGEAVFVAGMAAQALMKPAVATPPNATTKTKVT